MAISPLLIAGFVVFTLGFLVFATVLFSNGGVKKSAQFRVMGELTRGVHGQAARLFFFGSFPLLAAGACLCFAAVGSSDRERAQQCEERCVTEGFDTHRIGPNSDRTDDRATWFVACICESEGREPIEFRANDLAH